MLSHLMTYLFYQNIISTTGSLLELGDSFMGTISNPLLYRCALPCFKNCLMMSLDLDRIFFFCDDAIFPVQ